MQVNRVLEQHIAVFGESGSGKTVMLSSFYGAAQERSFVKQNKFNIIADDSGQGTRLHRNYLGMRDSDRRPKTTRFAAASYDMKVKFRIPADARGRRSPAFDALRLVWHDYPGEWFHTAVSGEEEKQRRIDTFRSLLRSDVALLMVDGQRLVDNKGEEQRYLKSLFTNVRNTLLHLQDDVLDDGNPLIDFPRIWFFALAKSDLLPEIDAVKFRDLLIAQAGEEIVELREVLASMVVAPEALSVGEDFLIVSSAKFDLDDIDVTARVGLDLILPIAAVLPFERHAKWAETLELPRALLDNLLNGAAEFATVFISRQLRVPGPIAALLNLIGRDLIDQAANLAVEQLRLLQEQAIHRRDVLSETLIRFRLDLNRAEEDEGVLLRSPK